MRALIEIALAPGGVHFAADSLLVLRETARPADAEIAYESEPQQQLEPLGIGASSHGWHSKL